MSGTHKGRITRAIRSGQRKAIDLAEPPRLLRGQQVPVTGFGGVRERRMVVDSRLTGHLPQRYNWDGLGDFVYLSDAVFEGGGSTGYHEHSGLDIVTIVVQGRLLHTGSLGSRRSLQAPVAQIQIAGREGFGHDERNPGPLENRVIQLMFLRNGQCGAAQYRTRSMRRTGCWELYRGGSSLVERHRPAALARRTVLDAVRTMAGEVLKIAGKCRLISNKGT